MQIWEARIRLEDDGKEGGFFSREQIERIIKGCDLPAGVLLTVLEVYDAQA